VNPTKFFPPRPGRVFARDRLQNRLLEWEDKKLVIIHAQAGQSKSTLAAEYVHALGSPSVWYNLDQEDENPNLFLSLLGQTVHATWPKHVSALPPMPRDRYNHEEIHPGTHRWIETLLNAVPRHCLFFFDEYHCTSSSGPAQRLIRLLIDQCKDLADAHALQSIGFLSLDISGWLKIAQGDYRGAELLLAECKQQGEESRNMFFSASAAHLLAIAYLFQGRLGKAKKESDYALAIRTQTGSSLFHVIYLIASGVIHLKLGNIRRAKQELLTAVKTLRQIKAAQQEANAHLALALLYHQGDETTKTCRHLHEGFSIGQDRGFTYFALFTRAELTDLANFARSPGICAQYCTDLIDVLSQSPSAKRLRVHCLGGFRVRRDRTLVRDAEWKSKRAKTLVKMLAAQDSQSMPREQAMEWLWPDGKPADLRMTLIHCCIALERSWEPEPGAGKDIFCTYTDSDVVALNRDWVWTDVGQFLSHLDAARRLKANQNRQEMILEYEKAAALYEEDFLPEDRYSDWAIPMRDQLRVLYLGALADAATLAEASGDRSAALKFHEQLFLADPCNEKSCCWLMMRYQSEGKRNDAIRSYERCELHYRGNSSLSRKRQRNSCIGASSEDEQFET
jgi:DNA-binding SARP family transcriptional activator